MTQRALARRATISLEAIPGYPPCTAALAAARDLLDHDRTRYKTHAWDGAPTGRFYPVHNWPVFRCPLRFAPDTPWSTYSVACQPRAEANVRRATSSFSGVCSVVDTRA